MLNCIILNNKEEYIKQLDTSLCYFKEKNEVGGFRTLELTYHYTDLHDDKQLFKIGNKVFITGDNNLSDCLYVINTPVAVDVYKEASFTVSLEEVLVELNYTPLFTENELKASNGFHLTTQNGQKAVRVDWNALHYWFGKYYNIGVVQDTINSEHAKTVINGSIRLIELLRKIEEDTGNKFVTRYELDTRFNIIHPYLDFLNPINTDKAWLYRLEYDKQLYEMDTSMDEYEDVVDADDIVYTKNYLLPSNLSNNLKICIVDPKTKDIVVEWNNIDIGFDVDKSESIVFELTYKDSVLACMCQNKTAVIVTETGQDYLDYVDETINPLRRYEVMLKDDSLLQIYDNDVLAYETVLNTSIGSIHESIIDFGYNASNIKFVYNEEETYNVISPVFRETDSNTPDIISRFKNLKLKKGTVIPATLAKYSVNAPTYRQALQKLGTWNLSNNYYSRPVKPQDNRDEEDSSKNTYEFYRATSYKVARYNKEVGEFGVGNENPSNDYNMIYGKTDNYSNRDNGYKKTGTVEIDADDIYDIYNQCSDYLHDHENKKFEVNVDVNQLPGDKPYDIFDRVFLKLPDFDEVYTATVSKIEKEAGTPTQNVIELSNYKSNVTEFVPKQTIIEAENVSVTYPHDTYIKIRLTNVDYDKTDKYDSQHPSNRMITSTLYSVDEKGNETLTKVIYNRLTDYNGYANMYMRLPPNNYNLHIRFGGDEVYEPSELVIKVNVNGKVPRNDYKGKSTKKFTPASWEYQEKEIDDKYKNGNNKIISHYWSRHGVSPDEEYVTGIGKPAAYQEHLKYNMNYFYSNTFVRKCPHCGSKELYWNLFWTGNEFVDTGYNPVIKDREDGSTRGHFSCQKCGRRYSVTGWEMDKSTGTEADPKLKLATWKDNAKLTVTDKTTAYKLLKGKLLYDYEVKKVDKKKVENTHDRNVPSYVSDGIIQLAKSIVGDSVSTPACKKIMEWSRHNLRYLNYGDFVRDPDTVLRLRAANCCDSMRFVFTLMAAAGCLEYVRLEYMHTQRPDGHGHVFGKITNLKTGKYVIVDATNKYHQAWGNYNRKYGTISSGLAHKSVFPKLPF